MPTSEPEKHFSSPVYFPLIFHNYQVVCIMIKSIHWPCFYTATILEWKHVLRDDFYKDIIISSLQYLVKKQQIQLFGFVIMSNHIHLIWQILFPFAPEKVQQSFMKYTAQKIKFELGKRDFKFLEEFKVNASDRQYQIWERLPLKIELFTPAVFFQKLEYIHQNPVKAGLCNHPEGYYYSSAAFYSGGIDSFNMLTHYYD